MISMQDYCQQREKGEAAKRTVLIGDYIEGNATSGTVQELRTIKGIPNAAVKTPNGARFHIPLNTITRHVKKEDAACIPPQSS